MNTITAMLAALPQELLEKVSHRLLYTSIRTKIAMMMRGQEPREMARWHICKPDPLKITNYLCLLRIHKYTVSIPCSENFLHHACQDGNLAMVQLQHKLGADLCAYRGRIFLNACRYGHTEIIRMLMAVLTVDDIRARDNLAFRYACYYGRTEIVRMLMDVLTVDDMRASDNYAFCNACINGHTEIVQMLMQTLTVSDMRAWDGTAFRNAWTNSHTKIVEMLKKVIPPNP